VNPETPTIGELAIDFANAALGRSTSVLVREGASTALEVLEFEELAGSIARRDVERVAVYHGTAPCLEQQIRRDGLRGAAQPGFVRGLGLGFGRPEVDPYVTINPWRALGYALTATVHYHLLEGTGLEEMLIVTAAVPPDRLVDDPEWEQFEFNQYLVRGGLGPDEIFDLRRIRARQALERAVERQLWALDLLLGMTRDEYVQFLAKREQGEPAIKAALDICLESERDEILAELEADQERERA
jgi:hypothetical protein